MPLRFILILCLFIAHAGYTQVDQEFYNKAKTQFALGNYQAARQYFQSLINDNPKNPYAVYSTFYHALSSFKIGDTSYAHDTWKQLLAKYPQWEKAEEVYYWLIISSIKSGKANAAFGYAEQLKDSAIIRQVDKEFNLVLSTYKSEEKLDSLYKAYPFQRRIAIRYAELLSRSFLNPRAPELLTEINERFGLDQDLLMIKKDKYRIAVLLPFMYESMSDTRVVSRNKFVLDLYQGMVLAAEDLKSQGMNITLHPYDTKRSKEATAQILEKQEMLGYDLIVGPLYPEPFQLVNEFSIRNRINMINPLSSNTQIIEGNPFSFLLKPTYETMAWATANYAIKNLQGNKNVLIFYDDDERLQSMAKLYEEILVTNGFNVIRNTQVPKNNNRIILETLTRTSERRLSSAQRDSVSRLPRRFVKERTLDGSPNEVQYYEERYRIGFDSIGHILVASNNTLIAANAVGGVEIRGDKIPLIGMGEWMNFNVLTLEQLERLGVALIHPNNVKYQSQKFYEINKTLTNTYRQPPSLNQYSGYDVMWLMGTLMKEYGVYFQMGLQNGKLYEGQIFEGYRYGFARDNQVVPIVKMKDSALQIVNDIYE